MERYGGRWLSLINKGYSTDPSTPTFSPSLISTWLFELLKLFYFARLSGETAVKIIPIHKRKFPPDSYPYIFRVFLSLDKN